MLRPTTTARLPAGLAARSPGASASRPSGVHGDRRVASRAKEPGVERRAGRRRPSPAGATRRSCSELTCFGSGSWTRMPCTESSALSGLEPGLHLGVGRGLGEVVLAGMEADLGRGLLLAGDVESCVAGSSPTRMTASPGTRPVLSLSSRVPWATSCLTFSAMALPSISVAAMAAAHYTSRAVTEAWLDAGRRPSVASAHVSRAHRPAHPRGRSGGAAHALVARPPAGLQAAGEELLRVRGADHLAARTRSAASTTT